MKMKTDKFVNNVEIEVKGHKTCYWTVEQELLREYNQKAVLISDMRVLMEKDYMARLSVYVEGTGAPVLRVVGDSVACLMKYLEEHHSDLFKQIPTFDAETFENIAAECEASSSLTLERFSDTEEGNEELESAIGFLGEHIELDDFVVEYESVEDYYKEVKEKRITTVIRCYPNSPVGSWSYHGLDFQSLLDYVTKEEKND
jgi:hypothetical protein